MNKQEIALAQGWINDHVFSPVPTDGQLDQKTSQAAAKLFSQLEGNPVVASYQALLNERGAKLKVDGVYGSKTKSASHHITRKGDSKQWITRREAMAIIWSNAERIGVDPNFVLYALDHEATKKGSGLNRVYDAYSVSSNGKGSYRGLMQMGTKAWEDARKVLRPAGYEYVEYKDGVFDPRINLIYAMGYMVWAFKHASRLYGPLPETQEIYYACFNQGPGFIKVLKRNVQIQGDQSHAAVQSHVKAQGQIRKYLA